MGNKNGLSANRESPTDVKTSGISQLSSFFANAKGKTQVGKVRDIILNKNFPNIENFGGFNAIGSIFFTIQGFKSGNNPSIAKPLFPQFNYYPLINELVLILELPDANIGTNDSQKSYYYLNVINLWNAPNHNAYPDEKIKKIKKRINNYQASSLTNQPSINTSYPPNDNDVDEFKSNLSPSQNTFIEKENIHPLQPNTGDSLYQGRWGNSLRFSSTASPKDSIPLNDWSSEGKNGSPITILRNGQPKEVNTPGWEPIFENINLDLSSIYLTSTQKIKIKVASNNYKSYIQGAPTEPKDYTGNQVIINSGRLVFNSTEDHILLSSQKTINLNSNQGLNFDTDKSFIVNAKDNVLLGSRNASESLVLGNSLKNDLDFMFAVLMQLVDTLQYSTLYPGGLPVPDSAVSIQATNCFEALKQIKDNLPNILSTKVKTI